MLFTNLPRLFKMRKLLILFQLEMIMEVNFKMSILKNFVKKMEFTIIFQSQEHLNRMVLWRGKIDPLKKVQEPL